MLRATYRHGASVEVQFGLTPSGCLQIITVVVAGGDSYHRRELDLRRITGTLVTILIELPQFP